MIAMLKASQIIHKLEIQIVFFCHDVPEVVTSIAEKLGNSYFK